ncbi:MAG: alpha-L-fucosidase [Dehalococcoidia bacterium]
MKELMKWNFATKLETYKSMAIIAGRVVVLLFRGKDRRPGGPDQRKWWQKPGVSVQYQIEKRPNVGWDRDYVEFNKSITDENGNLKFNGPFCKIDDWIALSKEIGLDYHSFEIKWHDGICWFNTGLTKWKTDVDYAGKFADLSRKEKIPFIFYYSSVFDHSPQFDTIQPNPHMTPSFLGLLPGPVYETYGRYLRGQYDEIVKQYKPDGMWLDWWWADKTTKDTISHFRGKYPDVALAFNLSSMFFTSHKDQHFTSGEAHALDGPFMATREEAGGIITVIVSTWKWANLYRMLFKHPWEIITPTSVWWQDMALRTDIYEFVRQAAVIMACGGKFCAGTSVQMDGSLYPDHIKQLKTLGEWYIPRKKLFLNSYPVRYLGLGVKGVSVNKKDFNTIATLYAGGILLHVINMKGKTGPIEITLKGGRWKGLKSAYLEPEHRQVEVRSRGANRVITLSPGDVDRVDTIIHLQGIDGI